MALGYTVRDRGSFGDLFTRIVDITFDASYAGGGYALDARQCGFAVNGQILMATTGGTSGGFFLELSPATGKLIVRDASGAAGAVSPEVPANAAALNGVVGRVLLFGKGQG
jgi:hypothetical protein